MASKSYILAMAVVGALVGSASSECFAQSYNSRPSFQAVQVGRVQVQRSVPISIRYSPVTVARVVVSVPSFGLPSHIPGAHVAPGSGTFYSTRGRWDLPGEVSVAAPSSAPLEFPRRTVQIDLAAPVSPKDKAQEASVDPEASPTPARKALPQLSIARVDHAEPRLAHSIELWRTEPLAPPPAEDDAL